MKRCINKLWILLLPLSIVMLIGCSKYKVKGNKIYYIYWPDEAHCIETELTGCDVNSFKVLDRFFSMDALTGFDRPFAKDRNRVYYRGGIITGADPATFKPANCFYSVDANHIFYEDKILSRTSPKSLRILKDNYALDSDSVYWKGRVIAKADPKTFKALGKSYACDSNNAYLNGLAFEWIENPLGFRVVDFLWGRDGRAYYFRGVKVEGADYTTFSIVYDGYSASSSYAKDKDRVYYCNTYGSGVQVCVVEEADPITFKLTGSYNNVGIDRNGYYKFGEKVDKSKVMYDLGLK